MRRTRVRPNIRGVDIAAPTRRKKQVLELVAAGYATKQIAAELGISGAAVDKHLRELFRRYAVPNRAALVANAFRHAHLF
jgi:DNA-binding NarL/FixJ family response regulator